MNKFEDHFSSHARGYAQYRPTYPDALFVYLAAKSPGRSLAWDCATGNGQAALKLVEHFDHVVATDASADQIAQATTHERINYRVERAEDTSLQPHSVDLVTVAIAVHWFEFDGFYATIRRVLVPNGIVAVWTYHLPAISPRIDNILKRYYAEILAGYWPERFRYVDERYRTLPFPFDEIDSPPFTIKGEWELDQLVGFLDSWSATQRCEQERGQHPVEIIWKELTDAWGKPNDKRSVRWPLYLRVGRVNPIG